jgi:phage terminase small subunit
MAEKKKPTKKAKPKKTAKPRKLTNKQLAFVDCVLSGMKNTESYLQAYNPTTENKTVIRNLASRVANGKSVKAAIASGRKALTVKVQITAEDLLVELEEARMVSRAKRDGSGMTRATMGKASLLGLDKKVIEIQNAEELTPWSTITAGVDENAA